jgi:tetratricopeptide (TPR) repeat protein
LYQQALRELPNNRDALLGLAATAIQLGDVTGARITYTKLLELDPRDVLARVGLMDSMPMGDSVQTETQLQSLKTEHPDVAQLAFALGNFYASQRRWNEAQAAYYDALLAAKAESGSQVSPDFAFNLAVSLERLNQQQPAFNFYREALEQARVVNPGFDVRVLRERLDALERVLP